MNTHDNSASSRNPSSSGAGQLSDEAQNIKLAEEGDASKRAELASNSGLSHSLQSLLLQDKEESVLAALASNPSLHDEVQEHLFRNGSIIVRINIARNPALKVALQKQLSRVGNVDIRLALLDNPSLDELFRNRVVASFTHSDLTSVEDDVKNAERKSDQLYSEHKVASRKCINSYGVIFQSPDEKIDKLTDEVDRIQNQINAVEKEIDTLKIKYQKIFRCLYPAAMPRID